ncbi:hypothetical protein DV515_00009766 [Chloebia gouldiae]|uniref:Uncharacterized protein n=1 Tax=Chloebia gouldiae TaxID=44316 RepID=A0A3L8SBK0_CHLGU|nr:hypothetical protein DV515_00009766 [Chloebia gouldiae]
MMPLLSSCGIWGVVPDFFALVFVNALCTITCKWGGQSWVCVWGCGSDGSKLLTGGRSIHSHSPWQGISLCFCHQLITYSKTEMPFLLCCAQLHPFNTPGKSIPAALCTASAGLWREPVKRHFKMCLRRCLACKLGLCLEVNSRVVQFPGLPLTFWINETLLSPLRQRNDEPLFGWGLCPCVPLCLLLASCSPVAAPLVPQSPWPLMAEGL